MFRRRVLPAVLTLGMFVGTCDVTALYPGVSQPLGFNPLESGKITVLMKPLEDPPGGVNDPPGGPKT